jgi:predicted PurR-regulated permease PerM
MPTAGQQTPFHTKFAHTLIIILALGYLVNKGQNIISPLLIAMLFAILLRPVAAFLNQKFRFPNMAAALVTVLLFCLLIAGIFYFISSQIAAMADDWDSIKSNLQLHSQHLQDYLSDTFNLSPKEQEKFIKDAQGKGKQLLGATLLSFTDALFSMLVIPIFMFLTLLYRTHFANFICRLFDAKHHEKLHDIIDTIKVSVQSYIMGLLFELLIVSTLTTLGLWIIGVKYAILLGVITGLLNLIPYVGIFVAGLLSIITSLTGSSDLSIIIGIIVVNLIVQFIDNNLLVPLVVSSKVEINSLATIVGIIVAGTLAGVAGMFLAIPMMAICKVIFDRVDSLQAWGYLLGDELPKSFRWKRRKNTAPIEKIVRK